MTEFTVAETGNLVFWLFPVELETLRLLSLEAAYRGLTDLAGAKDLWELAEPLFAAARLRQAFGIAPE